MDSNHELDRILKSHNLLILRIREIVKSIVSAVSVQKRDKFFLEQPSLSRIRSVVCDTHATKCSFPDTEALLMDGERRKRHPALDPIANSFEPAGDRLSNFVGTVLLHEVETSDDDAVLVRLGTKEPAQQHKRMVRQGLVEKLVLPLSLRFFSYV